MKMSEKDAFESLSKDDCYFTGIFHAANMFKDEFLEMETQWGRKAAEHLELYLKTMYGDNNSETSEEK